ncbi:MAG: SDR family NAD(P)-dependent oxidoreductase [Epsilonproteobacteria bacterium]|nr:SDR family NAD(P)-dependent oxidoreductase [Campylobacterota bacterium]
MKNAIVTGASSGIGEAVAKTLLEIGYHVIGISRRTNETLEKYEHFETLQCDLSDEDQTIRIAKELQQREIFIHINCAGFGAFAPHEALHVTTIAQMSFVNLTAPMILTNATLKSLKQNGGYLINITSIEALRSSRFSAVYSATKAGLKAFGDVLFEETRKSDLSVTNINPDMTQTDFFEDLSFDVDDNENTKLFVSDIVEAIKHILSMRKGAVVSNYTIRGLNFGIKKKSRK